MICSSQLGYSLFSFFGSSLAKSALDDDHDHVYLDQDSYECSDCGYDRRKEYIDYD